MGIARTFVAFDVSQDYRKWIDAVVNRVHLDCGLAREPSKVPAHCSIHPPFDFDDYGLEGACSLLTGEVQRLALTRAMAEPEEVVMIEQAVVLALTGDSALQTHAKVRSLCQGIFGTPKDDQESRASISMVPHIRSPRSEQVARALAKHPVPTVTFPFDRIIVYVQVEDWWQPKHSIDLPCA